MSYELVITRSAQKELNALPAPVRTQVGKALEALKLEPRPHGAEALTGQFRGHYRVRGGDYRVMYAVDDAAQEVVVTRIRHRGRVYR